MNIRNHIFEKYNLSLEAQIGKGMEAEVYQYRDDAVLKIYAGTTTFNDLVTLKDFYNSLGRNLVPYQLPRIDSITQEDDCIVTIEQRLLGRPLSSTLPSLNNKQLDKVMQEYLSSVLALANINAPVELERLKLFDPAQLSSLANGDWHQFLSTYLKHKLHLLDSYLKRDVLDFSEKFETLNVILASPHEGDYKLIHGDFCPGNLLIDHQHQATALLDFGLLTMYGDHLFDVATGWVFFDMYNELKRRIYERFWPILIEAVGEDKRGILYRYILIYSILSANTYSKNCNDGHYHWCVTNLNNQQYWKYIS